MGCDIHPYIEYRSGPDKPWKVSAYGGLGRNYNMFAILADVRNYEVVPPLFASRGFPEDCSPQMQEELHDPSDWHSHSYITLREILDTDWDAPAFPGGVRGQPSEITQWLMTIRGTHKGDLDPEALRATRRDMVGLEFFLLVVEMLTKSKDIDNVRFLFFFDN